MKIKLTKLLKKLSQPIKNKSDNIKITAVRWLNRLYSNIRKPTLSKSKEVIEMENVYKLQEVFGITNKVPNIYIKRNYVDNQFTNALERRKHIVIYGCSKQGKTSLRKKYLNQSNSIVIQCTDRTTREKIYEIVLKEAGVELSRSKTETISGIKKVNVSISGESSVLFAKAKGEVGASFEKNKTDTITKNYFEIDPSDVNDVIRILLITNFSKWIILEDFHYLSNDMQQSLSADLKAIFEKTDSIRIIVIGVWLETGKLTKLNGDLDGRITYINADVWEEKELLDVIKKGEKLLNITFTPEVKEKITFFCENNVGLLHQIIEKICDKIGITKTQSEKLIILDESEIKSLSRLGSAFQTKGKLNKKMNLDKFLLESYGIVGVDKFNYHGGPLDIWLAELSKERSPRYSRFLREFADGPKQTSGNIYRLIIYAIIKSSHKELRDGLTINRINKLSEPIADEKISKNDFRSAFHKIREFHIELQVSPPILDYDATEDLLRIVDSGLLLYHSTYSVVQMLIVIGIDPKLN